MTPEEFDLIATLAKIVLPILGGLVAVIVLLGKWVLKGQMTQTEERFKQLEAVLLDIKESLTAERERQKQDRKEEQERRDKERTEIRQDLQNLGTRVEGVRDRWDGFLRQFYTDDATRSNKVDALFRRLDETNVLVGELKPALSKKLEENIRSGLVDLRSYVRSLMREETDGKAKE